MAREKEAYRDNLERICAAFPNREVLTVAEVARYLGKDRRTLQKWLPFQKGIGISVVVLARHLS